MNTERLIDIAIDISSSLFLGLVLLIIVFRYILNKKSETKKNNNKYYNDTHNSIETSEILVPDKIKEKANSISSQNNDAKRYKIAYPNRDKGQMKTEILKSNINEKKYKIKKPKLDILSDKKEKIDSNNNEDDPIKFL